MFDNNEIAAPDRPYIYDVAPEELARWMNEKGQPAYRARQVSARLIKGVDSTDDLTDIPKALRASLEEDFLFDGLTYAERRMSALDETVKYTGQLKDGNIIESVFMKYKGGTSVCISSQSGCRMGCTFCASTGLGFGRDLTSGEMLAQVALIGRDRGQRIDHVTIMGIGEPLENYDAVVDFFYRVNDPAGLNIGMRKLTVSTCGIVPRIYDLAALRLPITLAISLHAPNDRLRRELMPIAKRYPYDELMEACRFYAKTTSRRVTYEYALFGGVNDQLGHATELAGQLKGQLCHVNLIPVNEIPGGRYRRPSKETVKAFQQQLEKKGIACTVRRELGGDIQAACGQLRRTLKENN